MRARGREEASEISARMEIREGAHVVLTLLMLEHERICGITSGP